MRWKSSKLRAATIVAGLVVAFVCVVRVGAVNDSLWVNNGIPARTLVTQDITSTNSPYFERSTCGKTPQYANKYRWNGSKQVYAGRLDITNPYLCWAKTSFGIITTSGNDGYVRFGDVGAVARISFGGGTTTFLPQTNKYIQNYGSTGLYIYDLQKSDYTSTYGGDPVTDYYSRTTNPSYWVPKNPVTNRQIVVGSVGYSNNGEWLAVESDYFTRINVKTHEILTFGKIPEYQAGYGTPHHSLAISNDGRYAITSIGGNFGAMFRIYDLSTCTPVPDNPMALSTGCQSRDMLPVTVQNLPGAPSNASAGYIEFSDDGQSISYNAMESGHLNRYMITAPGKDVHLLEYLALGDSFSSGEGDNDGGRYYIAGTDGNGETINSTGIVNFPYWKEKCHISLRSYPYLLANAAGLNSSNFRSVACSGADLNDVLNTRSDGSRTQRFNGHFDQFEDDSVSLQQRIQIKDAAVNHFAPGRASQIEFVQKYKPRVATISIGGNDIDFAKKLAECVPPTSTCQFATTDRATTGIEISLLYDKLVDAYNKLKAASPTTRFYVVGYPQIASGGGMCSKNVLLDVDEREYATYTVDYLDRVIKAAAAKAGLNYLDVENSLVGKNLCSTDDKSVLAVNGLETGNDRTVFGDSHYLGYLANESYHPNNIGHAMMANALRADMGYAAIDTYNPCFPGIGLNCGFANNNLPVPLAYFGVPSNFTPIAHENVQVDDSVQRGTDITVNVPTDNAFKPGSLINFTLHSTPVSLGQATVAADGTASANLNIPSGAEPGYHTLHVTGVTPGNDSVDYYQSIYIYANGNDLDGDGVSNDNDACDVVDESNTDEDGDGIDDACDGYIGQVEQHPLYRVRQSDETKGEVTGRFYIERDVLEAKSKLNIVNDYDPDSDGWAIVGRTEGGYDSATQSQFWVDGQNVPHVLLNGESSATCTQLTPVSLAVVVADEERLLKAETPNTCPEPVIVPDPAPNPVPVQGQPTDQIQNTDSIFSPMVNPQISQSDQADIVTMGASSNISYGPFAVAAANPVTQFADSALNNVVKPVTRSDNSQVAGVATKIPNHFDGQGEYSTRAASEVGNLFLIGISVVLAAVLVIVLVVKSLASFIR